MKRYNNLYDKIVDYDNIVLAIQKASKRKKKRRDVREILNNIDFYAKDLQEKLASKQYEFSPYIRKTIYDGTKHKTREIDIPKFYPDQCIHWALMLQIEPLLKKRMYYYSCACIKNKGSKLAIKFSKKNVPKYRYCLKLDIKKFYPSINTQILKDKFNRIIKDKDTLDLIHAIIDTKEKGVPIGNYTSQWFANFYLTDLDNYIKHDLKIKAYCRYADDMVLLSNNKRQLHKARKQIELFLSKEDLMLKGDWSLFKLEKRMLDFVGYRFYQDHTTIRRNTFLRIKRRFKRISNQGLNLDNASAVISYNGIIKNTDNFIMKTKYVFPYVSLKKSKELISNENKKRRKTNTILCVAW